MQGYSQLHKHYSVTCSTTYRPFLNFGTIKNLGWIILHFGGLSYAR